MHIVSKRFGLVCVDGREVGDLTAWIPLPGTHQGPSFFLPILWLQYYVLMFPHPHRVYLFFSSIMSLCFSLIFSLLCFRLWNIVQSTRGGDWKKVVFEWHILSFKSYYLCHKPCLDFFRVQKVNPLQPRPYRTYVQLNKFGLLLGTVRESTCHKELRCCQ